MRHTFRLSFPVLVAASVISAAAIGSFAADAGPAARPNIVLLMADQFRADCLGSDGNKAIRTPNLDGLAADGARFRCAYTSTPSCTPARSGLLTGLSPWHHGMLGMGRMAEHYERELPALLHGAGYYAIGVGKMHYYPQRNLHGFDRTILDESGRIQTADFVSDYRCWFRSLAPTLDPDATGMGWNDYRAKTYALPEELHPTRWTADVAVRFVQNYSGASPFFLKVSFARPHSPYDPPERFMKMYTDAQVPAAHLGSWASGNDVPLDPPDYNRWRGNLGPEQVRQSRRAYYGSVTFVDEQIGRILAALRQRKLLDNTLILFTADHGDMLGDHHLWRKTYAYESSVRIPMLIRWPVSMAAERGQVLAQPVELRDVLPTFLDAAGIAAPADAFDGKSLLELVRGNAAGWRSCIDLEHSRCYRGTEHWNALTDGRTKYIFFSQSGKEQLFDLQSDPGELHDLAGDAGHRELLETWRARMVRHLAERGPAFVRDGKLVSPRPDMLYGDRFPKKAGQEPSSTLLGPR
ncbi:MAG TPA: arylsulfatase [Phycisphaerae bacterium]|nr:arylsulfatase [Phycisphaerae bacterium]HSA25611.1 arylsulfatase [Phycisphaerae bacterium]